MIGEINKKLPRVKALRDCFGVTADRIEWDGSLIELITPLTGHSVKVNDRAYIKTSTLNPGGKKSLFPPLTSPHLLTSFSPPRNAQIFTQS